MNNDYYALLGIEPSADLAAIKKAYRRKAMECHPDRGGSHEAMVLVNEAWEVLSTPELRATYDVARTRSYDRVAQDRAAADSRDAHQRASEYPRRWEDFEKWLSGVCNDFANAKHGSTPLGFGSYGLHFPTVDNSFSGCLFITIGVILGILFDVYLLADLLKRYTQIKGHIFMMLLGGPLFVGAWLGAAIHKAIGQEIKMQSNLKQAADRTKGDDSGSRLINCKKCNQTLRVPGGQLELLVTCTSCGYKFSCPPG